MKFLSYTFKTLWRHRSRTLLTVSGSAVAIYVFCFVGAIREGMNDLKRRQMEKGSLIVFQANKFCPATSHLPQDYADKISQLPGVRDVVPVQVFTNNCRASLDVIVFYGVPPEKLDSARDFRLISGNWQDFKSHQDAAIIGSAVAARRGIKLGEKFSIGDLTVNIAGIFEADDPAEENYIYSHLEFLQRGKGLNLVGMVTQHEVLLQDGVDSAALCQQIDDLYRGGPVETDTRSKGVFQAKSLGDLSQLIEMAQYLGFACVGLVMALVATTTVMAVQDRVQEYAVLQTLGFSASRIFGFVLSESSILSFTGGTIGVIAAMITLYFSQLSVAAEAVAVAFTPSLTLALQGILISIFAGLLAGAAPAWQAASTEVAPALRHG